MDDPGTGVRRVHDPKPARNRGAEFELVRLRTEAALHQRLRDLTAAFSRGVSSTLGLEEALTTLASDLTALFGGRRTAVWLYRRRARDLVLTASSHPSDQTTHVSTEDVEAPAVRGLRLEVPAVSRTADGSLLLTPLRGWRRALGTVIVEGPFTPELDDEQLTGLANELSRQLSAAIESIQLLQEIIRQRRLLEDTFNSIVDLVVVTDNQLRIVHMNDAFAARTGRPRAELLEQRLDSLLDAQLASWVTAGDVPDAQSDGGDGGRTRRAEDARLGGTFSVKMTPLINALGEPAGHVVVARDITHQTRLEKEQEALRERLGQSEKLAALGQFVAGIAHEMNNPLQGVLGHLELLIQTSEQARPLRRDLRRIYHEADRAAKIVRNLLVFTGSRRMNRRRLRVGRVLSRALTSRAASLKRAAIDVRRDEQPDLPAVMGDPLLMHQAFLNILVNAEHAILHSGKPGRIEVDATFDQRAGMVITKVRDTGPGIPTEVLPRIFDPFFTTKEVGQGTGLGLAITYGIVQEHGGTIHAANAAGGGALFTIELPAAE
jgi:PAS domain S-box-containing protein